MASPDPIAAERAHYLALLGRTVDDPAVTLSQLRAMTGAGVDARNAAEAKITEQKVAPAHPMLWIGKSGTFVGPASQAGGSFSAVQSELYPRFGHLYLWEQLTFDQLVFRINDTGTSRFIKIGIFSTGGGPFPNAVVYDSGAIPTDTAGVKQIAINLTLPAGLYMIGGWVSADTMIESHSSGLRTWADESYTYAGMELPGTNYPTGALSVPPRSAFGVGQVWPWIRLRVA